MFNKHMLFVIKYLRASFFIASLYKKIAETVSCINTEIK